MIRLNEGGSGPGPLRVRANYRAEEMDNGTEETSGSLDRMWGEHAGREPLIRSSSR